MSTVLWAELKTRLIALLKSCHTPPPAPNALESAMRDAFAATDARCIEETGSSGSTATCALHLGETICIANLGDSRTVLCRSERSFWHTEDHKPDLPSERARIEARGGFVATPRASGEWNVPRLNGVLSVSRAFGDAAFKVASTGPGATSDAASEANLGALSAEPETTSRAHNPIFDEFLLLASDGLWDVMGNSAAIEFARAALKTPRPPNPPSTIEERVQKAVDRLVGRVVHSGHCMDNVTILIVMLCDQI